MERQLNRPFPDDKAIRKRGTRNVLIAKLIELCGNDGSYKDIEPILKAASILKITNEDKVEPTLVRQEGAVYLIRAQGAYKIGSSRAVYRRAAEITNQSATGAELIHHIITDDPEGIEKYWHGRFSAKRLSGVNKQSGEWFALSSEDLRVFKRRKFM